ncbi:MAG: hypothetical protein LBG64_00865 [Pseudomonadales bacterium]|nr:hypothetical protein [Pseudomonadales bacterium]
MPLNNSERSDTKPKTMQSIDINKPKVNAIIVIDAEAFEKWNEEKKEERVGEKMSALMDDFHAMPAFLRTGLVWTDPDLLKERMEWELAARRLRHQMVGSVPQKGGF